MAWRRRSRRFSGRPRKRMFKRTWLKVGPSSNAGLALDWTNSDINAAGGSIWSRLHHAPIVLDENPQTQFTSGGSPRELRRDLRITAVKGWIHHLAPILSDPTPLVGALYRVIEGIIVWPWQSAGGAQVTGVGQALNTTDGRYMNERWLWRRELMVNIDDQSPNTDSNRYTGTIIPKTQELIEFQPRVTMTENETLYWVCYSEVMGANSPHNHYINSEQNYPPTAWIDLRFLSWSPA